MKESKYQKSLKKMTFKELDKERDCFMENCNEADAPMEYIMYSTLFDYIDELLERLNKKEEKMTKIPSYYSSSFKDIKNFNILHEKLEPMIGIDAVCGFGFAIMKAKLLNEKIRPAIIFLKNTEELRLKIYDGDFPIKWNLEKNPLNYIFCDVSHPSGHILHLEAKTNGGGAYTVGCTLKNENEMKELCSSQEYEKMTIGDLRKKLALFPQDIQVIAHDSHNCTYHERIKISRYGSHSFIIYHK